MKLNNKFYVYKWYNLETGEIFYIGKGCKNRVSQLSKRNKLFLDYINLHECTYEIMEYFDDEESAFKREEDLIRELNPSCNIATGGYGGFSIVWTEELRKWKSENNPMKNEELRRNMSINNPMKRKEIASKVGASLRKTPIINGEEFKDCIEASEYFKVSVQTIQAWCKRGYDTCKRPCHYKGEPQKEYEIKIYSADRSVYIDDVYFSSVREASVYLEVKPDSLLRAINDNRKCKGHVCKYADQQPSQVNVEKENSNLEGSETNG